MIVTKKFCALGIALMIAATSAFANDWTSFHGSDRTNRSRETGLLTSWSANGPRLIFTATGLGSGYSGVTTAGNAIYTAGSKNGANVVFALDRATGRQLWETRVSSEWVASGRFSFARGYQGSRGTPTFDDGMVYYLSDRGVLVGLNAANGRQVWSLDLHQRYNSEIPDYGYSESPLVVGDRVYVAAFGNRATVVALNKKTGAVAWESEHIAGKGGFASIVPIEFSGVRQLVTFTSEFLFAVNMDNGRRLWSVPVRNTHGLNCTDILYHDGHVFASAGYGFGSMLVRLNAQGGNITAQKVWETKDMDNHHGGIVLVNGTVYGSGHNSRGWFALDFRTGRRLWNAPGKGTLTFADGHLYILNEEGGVSLVRVNPQRFEEVSKFELPQGGRGATWAHPVVSGGVLYLRHGDRLYAYDVRRS